MSWDVLSQFATNPVLDFFLKVATISTGVVVAITIVINYKSYNKMRMTDQIKLAQDFFRNYRDLQKESEQDHKQAKPKDERMDWAERYFNTLEWFSYLVNTEQITNPRLIGFYEKLIVKSREIILPQYYTQEEIDRKNLYPELRELYDKLKNGKIKVYRHKTGSESL